MYLWRLTVIIHRSDGYTEPVARWGTRTRTKAKSKQENSADDDVHGLRRGIDFLVCNPTFVFEPNTTSAERTCARVRDMACWDCYKGHGSDELPQGKEIRLYNLDVYIREPDTATDTANPSANAAVNMGKRTIVLITDAFGWKTNNIRLLADSYARRLNCKVIVPDFMYGRFGIVLVCYCFET